MLHKGISLSPEWRRARPGSCRRRRVGDARRNLAPAEIEGELARLDAALLRVEGSSRRSRGADAAHRRARRRHLRRQSLLVRSLVEPVTDIVREQRINVEARCRTSSIA